MVNFIESSSDEPLEGTAEFFHLSIIHCFGLSLVLGPDTFGNFISPDLLWILAIKPVFMIEFVPFPREELAVTPSLLVAEVEELVTELTGVEGSEKLEVGDSDELAAKLLGRSPPKDRVDYGAFLDGLHLVVPHHLTLGTIFISCDLTSIAEAISKLALVDQSVGELDILILNLVAIDMIFRNRGD